MQRFIEEHVLIVETYQRSHHRLVEAQRGLQQRFYKTPPNMLQRNLLSKET